MDSQLISQPRQVLPRLPLRNYLEERKVTFLVATPGSGKTTAMVDYLAYRNLPFRWINIPAGLDSIEGFCRILGEAFGPDGLPARSHADLLDKLKRLTADIRKDGPLCLVLDNFHHLADNRPILEEAERFAEGLPPTVRLFILSREQVNLSFRKIRVKKELLEIRNEDFIFQSRDVRDLFTQVYSIILPESVYEQIEEVTGGWITALILLIERLQHLNREEREKLLDLFFTTRTLPEIDDFFSTEVMARLSQEDQDLLLKIGSVDQISPALIEEITGQDGRKFLSRLEERNQFLSISDPQTFSYRFHPLFTAFLEREFDKLPPKEKKKTLLTISQFFSEKNQPHQAIEFLLRSGDKSKALKMLSHHSEALLQNGEYDVIRELLSYFTSEEISENLHLSYYQAISDSIQNPEQAQRILMQMLPELKNARDYEREARLYVVLLTSYFFYQSSNVIVRETVTLAKEFLEESKAQIDDSTRELLTALTPLGQWWISAAKEEAFEAALRAEETSHKIHHREAFLCSRLVLARIYQEKGEFRESRALLERTEKMFSTSQELSHLRYYRTLLSFYLGDAHFYLGNLSLAISEVQKGLSFASRDFAFRPYLQLNLVLYNLYLDDIEKAETLYNTLRNRDLGENHYLKLYINYLIQALMAYRNGNRRRAGYYTQRLLDPEQEELLMADFPFSFFPAAEIQIYLGDYDGAERTLNDLERRLEKGKYPHPQTTIHALRGIIQMRKGNPEEAKKALTAMESLIQERGYQNIDICDPNLLREVSILSGSSLFDRFPRLLFNREMDQITNSCHDLEIRTLGTFQVFVQGEEISSTLLSGQKRVMDLLKYLIIFRKNGVMKERVYELFWPRYSYKSARDNLNTIIYRLRKLMGDSQEYLITDVNTIHFNSGCTQIDLDTFLEFIEHAKKAEAQGNLNLAIKMYKEAVELYKGDFLEGDLYHDFIRDERENLKNKFRYILFRMTQLSLNSGDPMEGLKWAKRLVEADPLCEAGYRLLMICCALVGNRSEIPRLFEKLNKKLQTYYKITADNKTVLLKETLLSGRTPEEKLWNEETII